MDESLMRYLFAAVIAVFAIAADLESSSTAWTEPSFVVAEARSEPVTAESSEATENNSSGGTAKAWSDASLTPDAARDATPSENATATDTTASATASINDESASPDLICEAVKAAAAEHDIPIGFLVRLLWQESRFQAAEVSHAGAQGIAQFMPGTAVEMGLKDPFDPLQAIPASAKFLRKLHDQFGNLGLAAAAYNAGGGRIAKWLSRRGGLPKETRAYVKIITGHKAEAWIVEESTVYMPTDLPQKAPCEGIGGLSRDAQIAAVDVDLTPAASALLRKAEAAEAEQMRKAATSKLRVASSAAARAGARSRKANGRSVVLAAKSTRKQNRQSVRMASDAQRTKSSRAAREL
jgi:hypothetical protein